MAEIRTVQNFTAANGGLIDPVDEFLLNSAGPWPKDRRARLVSLLFHCEGAAATYTVSLLNRDTGTATLILTETDNDFAWVGAGGVLILPIDDNGDPYQLLFESSGQDAPGELNFDLDLVRTGTP